MDDLETTGEALAGTTAADKVAPVETAKELSREEQIVRAWFDRRVRNSPVSMSVEAFNHMSIVVEDLIEALKEG